MYSEKDLVEQSELMKLLGYDDERSFKKWCQKSQIPIIKIGLKKYILSQYLTEYIDNQLVIFDGRKIKPAFNESKYKPEDKTISNYLAKYESVKSSTTVKKR